MFKIIIILVVLIAIILFLLGRKLTNYTFYKAILRERKTKEDVFNVLKKRNAYDLSKYKELDIKTLEIKSKEGFKLKGYYIEKFKDSKKLMIIVHGYTSNHYIALQYLDMFFEEGFNILMVDVRGHGASEGTYATYGYYEREDLDRGIDYMKDKLGSEYDGVISGVMNYGLFIELDNTVEGFTAVESLEGTNYSYNEKQLKLSNGITTYKLGDKVRVKVVSVNLAERRVNFQILEKN